jgi:hypothetical protein
VESLLKKMAGGSNILHKDVVSNYSSFDDPIIIISLLVAQNTPPNSPTLHYTSTIYATIF